jgi:S1-C subfamily serine protease
MEKEKEQDLVASIVRICDAVGTPRGTGFLASADGLIVTCAHVVEAAGTAHDRRVAVRFARADEPCQAEVLAEAWRPTEGNDIAVLRLDGPPPSNVKPVVLG